MVQADVSGGEISCQQKFFHSFLNLTLGIIMAGNNATSEVGCFYHFEDLKNVLRFAEYRKPHIRSNAGIMAGNKNPVKQKARRLQLYYPRLRI